MALIASSLLSAISGSINGTTYARNRSGMYARNKSIPVNPNSPGQVSIRASFTAASQHWAEFTDGQRSAWNIYAASTPVTNKVGNTVFLSGFNHFMAVYTFQLDTLGAIENDAAPATGGLGMKALDIGVTASITGNDFELASVTTDATQAITQHFGLWVSNPQGPGVNFYKGPWNFLEKGTLNTLPVGAVGSPFILTADMRLWYRFRIYDEVTGKLGQPTIFGPRTPTT